ncbi:FtsX-like permease family protein [Candidatus Woesearchaeota archaeon]|nr:FtsX-like permease family protein [Candidatus Woesearchaeota archaeon]
MIKDYFIIAYKNLRERKLRSWLTILGIIISVASIVALISISEGLEASIKEQFVKFGSNRFYVVVPGGQPGTTSGLTTDDVDVLESIPDFEYVTPYLIIPSVEMEYSKQKAYSSLFAWPSEDSDRRFEDYDFTFKEGSSFREGQKYVAIFGSLAATELFDKDVHVNNKISMKDAKFEVVGVLESFGNRQDDAAIYIPIETARDLFDRPDEVSMIDVTVKSGREIDTVAERARRALERKRKDENFEILTPTQILKFLSQTLGIVQAILVSIAAISLVVGAVGIMNSMYTSVMERTKDIGIMKSIGARNRDIMLLFLVESGMIGFVGGIIGIILGYIASYGVAVYAASAGYSILQVHIDFLLILGGLLFATLVGMLSGILPSKRASKLHPVDALRWTQ